MIGPFQESDGSVSMRRILAAYFAIASVVLFIIALNIPNRDWTAFIPGGVCLGASLLMIFFTTWESVTELVKAVKGKCGDN